MEKNSQTSEGSSQETQEERTQERTEQKSEETSEQSSDQSSDQKSEETSEQTQDQKLLKPLEKIEKIAKRELISAITEVDCFQDLTLEDIKKDSTSGYILAVLREIEKIGTDTKDSETPSFLKLYLDAKEIVVENRKKIIACGDKLIDEFGLDPKNNELSYFLFLMYFFSIKINDIVSGLFKKMLIISNLTDFKDLYLEICKDESTEWVEPKDSSEDSAHMTYCSLNGLRAEHENIFIEMVFRKPFYVSKENIDLINGETLSKYKPIKKRLIIVG